MQTAAPARTRRLAGGIGAAVLAAVSLASPAQAAPFDAATGTVSLKSSALAWSFDGVDSLPAALKLKAQDVDGADVASSVVAGRFTAASTPVIEGVGAMWLGRSIERLEFRFAEAAALQGRRVEISFWQRPRGVEAIASLAWRSGSPREFLIGMVRFQPTGRRTDDGWFEVSSGPIDFALAGKLVPVLVIRVDRGMGGSISTDPNGLTLLDGLEVADLGERAVADARCTLPTEETACGSVGTCHFGRCVDAAAVAGRLPSDALRGEYVDRRIFEVKYFNGNRVAERNFGAYLAQMELARNAKTAREFWPAINAAYEKLEDGHGSPPYATMVERPAIGMCVHLGDADRLPDTASGAPRPLPLVFYADASVPGASQVQVGDALDTIDGLPVDQWKALAAGRLRHYGSPLAREVTIAPGIPAAAMRLGATVGFSRCPAEIAATRRCTADELVKVSVDYAALLCEPMWNGDASAWTDETFACDSRFLRLGGPVPQGGYMHVATGDDADVRTIEFNGVPHPSWAGSWVGAVQGALQPTSSKFLLDERTGYGGYFNTVDLLSTPFIDAATPAMAEVVPVLNRELDAATRDKFLECVRGPVSFYRSCGNFFTFQSGDYFSSMSGTLKDAKVAMLVSRDVSGNDFLTRVLKFRPATHSRVFGPCPTYGGFGSVYDLPTYLNELAGGSAQMSDSLVYMGSAPTPFAFESGPGVLPDEVVYQTQSDLLSGRDTLIERAKAWLRQP